jgi:hypothetical protein
MPDSIRIRIRVGTLVGTNDAEEASHLVCAIRGQRHEIVFENPRIEATEGSATSCGTSGPSRQFPLRHDLSSCGAGGVKPCTGT